MKRVIWLSRHELTEQQREDLKSFLGEEAQILSENRTWKASADAEEDKACNVTTWEGLAVRFHVVAGVFPPVALAALAAFRRGLGDRSIRVVTPVSEQTREERADGSAQIRFRHLRWQEL